MSCNRLNIYKDYAGKNYAIDLIDKDYADTRYAIH